MIGLIARYLLALMVLHMAAMPFSAEEIALAQIAQGEANHQFMRDAGAAAYAVGWVARNRLVSGKYGSSYKEVKATLMEASLRTQSGVTWLWPGW